MRKMSDPNKLEIPGETLSSWRASGLLSTSEIAYKVGDLIVAENVVTGNKRVIEKNIAESVRNKRVLKG